MKNNVLKYTSLEEFSVDHCLLDESEWFMVVKSQNQTERRNRLIQSKKGGKFGRIESRPTSIGLLAKVSLKDSNTVIHWTKEFNEPRHIVKLDSNRFALTDVNSVKIIDSEGNVLDQVQDPLFGFLHTIDFNNLDKNRVLVCSSGYDAIIESSIKTGNRKFLWSAWENGFNPDDDGNWLSLSKEYYDKLVLKHKNAVLIDSETHGEQGINTKFRSAHPNAAIYNPYTNNSSFIASIGHGGTLYEVKLNNSETMLVHDRLSDMPHGLAPYNDGWIVTNTTKGEFWFLDQNFEEIEIISFCELKGKHPELKNLEWVQNTKVALETSFLALDANRGLIAFDLKNKTLANYKVNSEWCLQDALMLR